MELTLDQIYDYNMCSMMYNIKYEMGLNKVSKFKDPTNKIQEEHFSRHRAEVLKKTMLFYYYQVCKGFPPSQEDVLKQFGMLFYEGFTPDEILGVTHRETREAPFHVDVRDVLKYLEFEQQEKYAPILVDHTAKIKIGDHNVIGTLELVRESKSIRSNAKKMVELGYLAPTTRLEMPEFLVHHDMYMTFQSIAFRKLFETNEDKIVIYNIRSCRKQFTLPRDNAEIRRMETIVNNTASAIERKLYQPVYSIKKCLTCPYKMVCDNYKY